MPEESTLSEEIRDIQVYDLSPDRICTFHVEQVEALSDNIWVITIYTQSQAIVAYTPEEEEKAVAAPWEGEPTLAY